METSVNENVPFTEKWKVFSKIDENLYVVCKKNKDKTIYVPMYVHTFKFIVGRDYNECDRFNLIINNPCEMEDMSDRIRYFRLRNSLKQEEVAERIGIDRSTYISYEKGLRYYPIEVMSKMADLFNIELDVLLDDYHKFIYFNQGQNIKVIRKDLGLKQEELSIALGVSLRVIKTAEQEKVRFMKKNYLKLISFYNENMNICV